MNLLVTHQLFYVQYFQFSQQIRNANAVPHSSSKSSSAESSLERSAAIESKKEALRKHVRSMLLSPTELGRFPIELKLTAPQTANALTIGNTADTSETYLNEKSPPLSPKHEDHPGKSLSIIGRLRKWTQVVITHVKKLGETLKNIKNSRKKS